MHTAFDNMPNDIDFDTVNAPVDMAVAAQQRFTKAKDSAVFASPCKRCGGTGRFTFYSGMAGQCFLCKGEGKQFFKSSAEDRAAAREKAQARKERALADNVDSFAQAHPEAWGWMLANPQFEFASSMADTVRKYGSLTDRQMAAVEKCVASSKARLEAREAERIARVANAPVVDATGLEQAFSKARDAGLLRPKITMGGMLVKPAPAHGANAGALYVTEHGQYLGKVMGGRFLKVRECSDEQATKVAALINDPKAAAEAYGKETGVCCICSRTLTNDGSIERGIGPICAEKFGW
jgi:hypothetical protein